MKLFNKQKRNINKLTGFIILIQINSLSFNSFQHKKRKNVDVLCLIFFIIIELFVLIKRDILIKNEVF